MTFTLTLPYGARLPLTANAARSTTHYRTQNTLKAQVHADVAILAAAAKIPPLPGADLTLTWQLPNRVLRDADGMAWTLKAVQDGLVNCGVLPKDDWRYVHAVTMRVLPPRKGQPGVLTLTITAHELQEAA